jgi:hypothetical protein
MRPSGRLRSFAKKKSTNAACTKRGLARLVHHPIPLFVSTARHCILHGRPEIIDAGVTVTSRLSDEGGFQSTHANTSNMHVCALALGSCSCRCHQRSLCYRSWKRQVKRVCPRSLCVGRRVICWGYASLSSGVDTRRSITRRPTSCNVARELLARRVPVEWPTTPSSSAHNHRAVAASLTANAKEGPFKVHHVGTGRFVSPRPRRWLHFAAAVPASVATATSMSMRASASTSCARAGMVKGPRRPDT